MFSAASGNAQWALPDPPSDDLPAIAAELDDEYSGILQDWDDDLDSSEEDELGWDEPEPLAEYDSELRQPLYTVDKDDFALSDELKIDQWVATKLRDATSNERGQIAELLEEFDSQRLRRWLPWLDQQDWTAGSLLLFLRFRLVWDSNPHWWEYSFWDWRSYCWYPARNRYSLSLTDSYDLIRLRLDHSPKEIIDETWLGDWLELSLWQRGFPSFAAFAVFRAGFKPRENWQRHLDWNTVDDSGRYDWVSDNHVSGYRCYRYGPPIWFNKQDWYDPCEWHDNLGW